MTPSVFGDLSFQVSAVFPLSTSTARFFIRTSDTGTVTTTSRALDLSRPIHVGATGGKPLDATQHPRIGGAPRFKSISVAVPLELAFHTSGLNCFVTVRHSHRAAAAGAGSTWEVLKTDVRRYKMGTDTDAVFLGGFVSSVPAQAVRRFYKANLIFGFRTATSTGAKDTSTSTELVCNSPVIILSGSDSPQDRVPKVVQ